LNQLTFNVDIQGEGSVINSNIENRNKQQTIYSIHYWKTIF